MKETLFSVLSTGLYQYTGGWSASLIHQKMVLHFCSIVFKNSQECTTIGQVLEAREGLEINPACVSHPVVKLWIKRVHAVEKHLHDTPEMWIKAYPKLFKAFVVQFIHYHRNYEKKPFRLFCRFMFCQLACELFSCSIVVVPAAAPAGGPFGAGGGGGSKHFYPLEAQDYYLPTNFPTLILDYLGKGNFRYKETQETEPLIDLQLCFVSESSQAKN